MFNFRGLLKYLLLGIFIIYLLLPMVLIIIGSFGEKWFGTPFPEGVTLEWFREVFSNVMFTRALWMSLFIAAMTVAMNLLIGIPAVYAIYMSHSKMLQRFFDSVIILPIAVPPLVMGMGLIQAYNWPFFSLVGTWQILLAAHCVFTLPFMIKPIMANLHLIEWEKLNEAAESLGAGAWFKTRQVLLPNLFPGIIAGALMTFAISLGEFQLAVLLSGSLTQTYPVALYQAFYFSTGFACSATSVLLVAAVLSLWGLTLLMKFMGVKREELGM